MVRIGNIILNEFPLLLAPMEDVSDPPFRHVCKINGADLMFTEFVSSEGLIRSAAKSRKKLDIFEHERPIGIQLFGSEVKSMREAAAIADTVNPDLIDINFGCPVKNVACRGAGAGLLQDIPKMVQMTEEVIKATRLPVTVKTRLGWDDNSRNIIEVAERLQDIGIKALTIHARTRVQMYKGQADWRLIGEVKNNPRMFVPIFGNGDIDSPQKAKEMRDQYGVDGIMIGRAAIGNPWIFAQIKEVLSARGGSASGGKTGIECPPPTLEDRTNVCKIHLDKSIEWKGEKLGILEMRRHYANYFKGIANAKELRLKLVTAGSYEVILNVLEEIGKQPDILTTKEDMICV